MAILSCNLPGRSVEPTPIPVSTESVQQLEEEILSAAATAQSGGSVELTFTEQQLTSLAATQLESQPDVPVKDIQVHLRNGQVEITGSAERSGLDLPFSVTLTISVDAQGVPRSSIIDASVGPLPVPQSILDQITARLDEIIVSQYASNGNDIVVDSITIYEGYMTIKGHHR
jgi:uncharacterized protein YpmS